MESPAPSVHISRTILSPQPQPHRANRRSLILPSPHLQEEEEEDVRSARQRRHSRGFSRVINLNKDPAAVETRPHLPWSQDQLKQHYSQCMKLSQENKINHKNAFELQLIEHMSEMIRKDGDLNFRTAGGTIYAGAKIYAGRVDAIYSEIYRVMNSLGGADKEEGEEFSNSLSQDGEVEQKTKRRKKNSKILETNVSNLLLANILMPTNVDVMDRVHNIIDAASCDSLKLNNLNVVENVETLLFDHQVQQISSQQDSISEENSVNIYDESTKSNSKNFLTNEHQQFADTFKELSFDIADLDVSSQDDFPEVRSTDGELPSGDTPEGDFIFEDDGADHHDEDDGNVVAITEEVFSVQQQQQQQTKSHDERMLSMCLASSPGEYSYFKPNILAVFDGNKHWKRSKVGKPALVTADPNLPDTDQLSEAPSQAKKRKKSTKDMFELDPLTTDKKLQPQKMSRQKLMALKSERKNNRVLQGSGMDRKSYTRATSVKVRIEPLTTELLQTHIQDYETDNFEYNNDDYCPAIVQSDHEDNYEAGDDNVFENTEFPNLTNVTKSFFQTQDTDLGDHDNGEDGYNNLLEGDHLVSQPRKIEKIHVTFAKRAKHIDVKKLKTTMWGLLKLAGSKPEPKETDETITNPDNDVTITDDVKVDPTNTDDVTTKDDVTKENNGILFSDVYKQLPLKMSEKMAGSLSVPLAFTCLLHLANEKGLKIEGKPTLSDLTITHEF